MTHPPGPSPALLPSLGSLQPLNIFLLVRAPELNTGLRVQSQWAITALVLLTTLIQSRMSLAFLAIWAHAGSCSAGSQPPQILFLQPAFQPLSPKPAVAVIQGQDPALGLVEFLTCGLGPSPLGSFLLSSRSTLLHNLVSSAK